MTTSILLSDILKNNGINPKDVVLIRHVLSREHCNKCFNAGWTIYCRLLSIAYLFQNNSNTEYPAR